MSEQATVPTTGKTRRRKIANKNAKVMWIMPNQQFNVAECHDVPWPIAYAYKRQHARDPKYNGGILVVVSMEVCRYEHAQ